MGAARGCLPLLPLKRSAWPPLWGSRPWGVDVGPRRTLEDPVKTGRHPLGVVAVIAIIAAIVLIEGLFLRLPLCLDFDRRVSSAWRSRFFFFSFFFFKSIEDFCFLADSRRLSLSTSSSFTGGLEDRTSIEPYASGDKF